MEQLFDTQSTAGKVVLRMVESQVDRKFYVFFSDDTFICLRVSGYEETYVSIDDNPLNTEPDTRNAGHLFELGVISSDEFEQLKKDAEEEKLRFQNEMVKMREQKELHTLARLKRKYPYH